MALSTIPAKGVSLLQSIAAVYTALQGLTNIEVSGRKSGTYPVVTLDGDVTEHHDPTGYAAAATIKASGFYNPAHATYTAFEGLIAAPVATNFKVTWSDAGPTSEVYSGTGFGIDKKAAAGQGVMADIEIVTSGNPS